MATVDQAESIGWAVQLHFPAVSDLMLRYHRRRDFLAVIRLPPQSAISIDVGGEGWVRVVPASGQVAGIEIEDFQSRFLVDHPDLAALWRRACPGTRGRRGVRQDREAFLHLLVTYFRNALAEHVPIQ